MREGMAAKSLKKKESKEIRVENQFLFSSKESGIVKWMHYSSCQRKKILKCIIFSIWSDGTWGLFQNRHTKWVIYIERNVKIASKLE